MSEDYQYNSNGIKGSRGIINLAVIDGKIASSQKLNDKLMRTQNNQNGRTNGGFLNTGNAKVGGKGLNKKLKSKSSENLGFCDMVLKGGICMSKCKFVVLEIQKLTFEGRNNFK